MSMRQYHELLKYILDNGEVRKDRTGVGTISVFGYQMRFDLREGFPAVTTKKLAWRSVVGELLWFLEGSTDERRLAELTYGKPREELIDKRTIWTDNADHQGAALGYYNDIDEKELGPIYGYQWRNFGGTEDLSQVNSQDGFDQITWLINEIKTNPDSRRLILSAWNPLAIEEMALPPCHIMSQFSVRNNQLSCLLYQRSADTFLGSPFNIASYALLTHILAKECRLGIGELVYTIGDAHIYLNHIDQVKEQLSRTPRELPTLVIEDDFVILDHLDILFPLDAINKFTLKGYDPYPAIKAPMAI
jgi:thymidylate synthase